MKNITEKESIPESDLEEGEIPDFESYQNADSTVINVKEDEKSQLLKKPYLGGAPNFGRMKDSLPVRIPNPSQAGLLKNSIYFPIEKGRYELPSVEGEYVSEESKPVVRNQVPENTFYDYNIKERRLKYLHPFQTTYGSVEHIMSKIGETLGRSNDFYYKGRRSNDPRSLLNNNIGATFRESGSLFRRFRSNYHKRRRYSESDSDSDRDIWETSGKFKSRNSTDLRRKEEKDFKKKRKPKSMSIDGETKKLKLPDKSLDETRAGSIKSTFGGSQRLWRAIRELQEKESEAAEVPLAGNDSKATFASSALEDKSAVPSCEAVNSDDSQDNGNDKDLSEKSSMNEDSDDDVELIKLRLLALTSNKKKNQGSTDEKSKESEEKVDENPKDLTEEEKEPQNSQEEEGIMCKSYPNNDIDRYELILRAEALKTALLKKCKHGIKKRKRSISIGHQDTDENVPENRESKLILSEEETKTNDEFPVEGDISGFSLVTISVPNNESVSENCEITLENSGPKSPDRVDLSKSADSNMTCDTSVHQKGAGRKSRKRRLKKNRKFGGLNRNELSIKENSRMPNEEDQKSKDLFSDAVGQKKGLKDIEKKFVLVDSSQLSKGQSVETKLSIESDQGDKDSVTGKPNDATSVASTPKIPETEIERIIVHLGSDSSDDEPLIHKSDVAFPKEPENVEPPSTTSGDAQSKIIDYENSVELLLKDARRRIEQNMEAPQKVPPTPEAVYNHLAPSQRLEYIRLKQKIAETEKLRKMKENTSSTTETPRKNQLKNVKLRPGSTAEIQKNVLSASKTSSGIKTNSKNSILTAGKSSNASFSYKTNKKAKSSARIQNEVNNRGARDVNLGSKKEDSSLKALPKNGSDPNSAKNILERKKTLTQNRLHLERLKALWKSIKMEKMIEDKCKNELKRLKIQQNFFELKVSQQRAKIKKLAEESNQIYGAFQRMNKGLEMFGKKKKNAAVGEKVDSEAVEGGIVSQNCSKVETVDALPEETKAEEGTLVEKIDEASNVEDKDQKSADSSSLTGIASEQLKEYNSPLQRSSTGSESLSCRRVDPNTIMCQYDLTGRCNDEECPYQHLRV